MFTRTLLTAAAIALAAGGAYAAPKDYDPAHPVKREDTREQVQQRRIQAGVDNGSLTKKEAARAEYQQARIQRAQDRARADGTMSPAEAAHIEKMQDKANQRIYDQKHDAQGTVQTPQNK